MKRTLLRMALVAGSLFAVAIPASANQASYSSIDQVMKISSGTSGGIVQTLGDMAIKKIEGVGDIIQAADSGSTLGAKLKGDNWPSSSAIDKAIGLQARGNDDHLFTKSKDSATARPVGGDDRSLTAATTMKQQPFGSDLGKRGRIDSDLSLAGINAPSTGAIDLTQADKQSDALTNIT